MIVHCPRASGLPALTRKSPQLHCAAALSEKRLRLNRHEPPNQCLLLLELLLLLTLWWLPPLALQGLRTVPQLL